MIIFIPIFIILLAKIIIMVISDMCMMYRVGKKQEELIEQYNNTPRGIIENECGVKKCHLLGDKGFDVCNECQ